MSIESARIESRRSPSSSKKRCNVAARGAPFRLGELEEARATQRRALAIQEAVYGPEHPEVARTLTNLGIVQQQLGEFEEARAHGQRAVGIFERFLGTDHDDTVQARALLASIANPADAARSQPRLSRRPWRGR